MIWIMNETFFWDRWDEARAAKLVNAMYENEIYRRIGVDVRNAFDINVIDWVWLELWCGRVSGTTTIPERCDT